MVCTPFPHDLGMAILRRAPYLERVSKAVPQRDESIMEHPGIRPRHADVAGEHRQQAFHDIQGRGAALIGRILQKLLKRRPKHTQNKSTN
jgi:hypothetical protein